MRSYVRNIKLQMILVVSKNFENGFENILKTKPKYFENYSETILRNYSKYFGNYLERGLESAVNKNCPGLVVMGGDSCSNGHEF